MLDVQNLILHLPREKIRLMALLVFSPTWDWGCRRIQRRQVQSARGNISFLQKVTSGIRPEAASFDLALGGDQESEWIGPAQGTDTVVGRFVEFVVAV